MGAFSGTGGKKGELEGYGASGDTNRRVGGWTGKLTREAGWLSWHHQREISTGTLQFPHMWWGTVGGLDVLALVAWPCKHTIFSILYSDWLGSRCTLV